MEYTARGILQARILEWVAFPFSRGSFQPGDRTRVSRIAGRSLPAEPPGKPKNTRVGSLSLLQWIFLTGIKPRSPALEVDSLPAEPQGKPKNTVVGGLSLLQRLFPTQESNQGLPHCRRILYGLSHQGSPRTLEWVAYPFFSRSSRPRNRTRVSCFAGRFFTS